MLLWIHTQPSRDRMISRDEFDSVGLRGASQGCVSKVKTKRHRVFLGLTYNTVTRKDDGGFNRRALLRPGPVEPGPVECAYKDLQGDVAGPRLAVRGGGSNSLLASF